MKTIVKACVLGGFIGLVGCAHRYTVAFQDLSYPVATKKYDAGVVAVIDRSTLSNTIQIQSFMAGVGNKWEAQPGEMLKQVADVYACGPEKSAGFRPVVNGRRHG